MYDIVNAEERLNSLFYLMLRQVKCITAGLVTHRAVDMVGMLFSVSIA